MFSQMSELYDFAMSRYGGRPLLLVPYVYPFQFGTPALPIASGGTYNQIINISANADFIALGLRHFMPKMTATISTRQAPEARILLTDTSSGDQFMNTAERLSTFSSNGLREIPFEFPRVIDGRGALNAQYTSIASSAEYVQAQFALHGLLVRAWDPDSRRVGNGLMARGLQ